jgi:hypothetical protein
MDPFFLISYTSLDLVLTHRWHSSSSRIISSTYWTNVSDLNLTMKRAIIFLFTFISRDSSVRKKTGYGPNGRCSIPDWGKDFSLRRHVHTSYRPPPPPATLRGLCRQVRSVTIMTPTRLVKGEVRKVKVKKKTKLSVWVNNWASRHEDVWGSGGAVPPFLALALDGGEWSPSRPGLFNPGKRERPLAPEENRNPAVQPTAHRYIDRAILAPKDGEI